MYNRPMSTPVLATKLYIPPPRPNLVRRPHLVERLHGGLHGKLTLVSAPAGFGKTTLVSEWLEDLRLLIDGSREDTTREAEIQNRKSKIVNQTAWLSLDEGDSDPIRFLTYLVAALQTAAPDVGNPDVGNPDVGNPDVGNPDVGNPDVGNKVLALLQSPQPPPSDSLLTLLLNDLAALPRNFVLVLDDYHVLDAPAVDAALAFLLDHLPPSVHLVITTREDPALPLARLRARGQLTELRAADLRFTAAEAAGFLNDAMGLRLAADEVAALEARTEGWIAGLQLAAISMQGRQDAGANHVAEFIHSFTGSHRFVMDYLVEEVLHQQTASVQKFLLQSSILDRLCGPLCDAVVGDSAISGQATLEALDQANLFIVPLDNERRWYRYHRLFADLLRQRLHQTGALAGAEEIASYHRRASLWYEENDLVLEAFAHATAANDVARAQRLIEGQGMPLHFQPGGVRPVLNWLSSLPPDVLNAYPLLWTTYASVLLVTGQPQRVAEMLRSAEAALRDAEPNDRTRDLIGRIAAIRATAAAGQKQVDAIIDYSRRALQYLHPNNAAFRTSTSWKLGFAYQLQGNHAAASEAYEQVIATGEATGNVIFIIMATIGLGGIQQERGELAQAAATYQRALALYGDQPLPSAGHACLGLAQIHLERRELDMAQQYAEQGAQLTELQGDDLHARCQSLLVQIKRARDDAKPEPLAGNKALVEPLSERELEVLNLVAAGKKNQEIADALVISLNTVRYHTKNLYGKLGVHKRTQAVAKARALGVL